MIIMQVYETFDCISYNLQDAMKIQDEHGVHKTSIKERFVLVDKYEAEALINGERLALSMPYGDTLDDLKEQL